MVEKRTQSSMLFFLTCPLWAQSMHWVQSSPVQCAALSCHCSLSLLPLLLCDNLVLRITASKLYIIMHCKMYIPASFSWSSTVAWEKLFLLRAWCNGTSPFSAVLKSLHFKFSLQRWLTVPDTGNTATLLSFTFSLLRAHPHRISLGYHYGWMYTLLR